MAQVRPAPCARLFEEGRSAGGRRDRTSPKGGLLALALALFLGSAFPGQLHAADSAPADLPARVFSLYNDRVYIEQVGYIEPGGFRPDFSCTPFFRTLNPAFVQNGTPDEIAAAAGKVLITQADWLNSRKDAAPAEAAPPAHLPPSARIYTIAGVSYVALRSDESSQVEAVVGRLPVANELPQVKRDPAVPAPGGNFMYWQ